MPTARPFAYNPSQTPITGASQIGTLPRPVWGTCPT